MFIVLLLILLISWKTLILSIANLSINSVGITKPKITDTDLISVGAGYSIIYTENLFIYSYLDLKLLSNGSSVDKSDIDFITIKFKPCL